MLCQKKSVLEKVLLTGILADSKDILDILEDNNISVVADDLAQETRQFRTDVPAGDDALEISKTMVKHRRMFISL